MLNKDLMQIVKDAFSTYTFREFRRNHETYSFVKSLALPLRLHAFAPSKDFSILTRKKVNQVNEKVINSTAKFPIFDITYTLHKKRANVKPLFTSLDKNAHFH